MNKSLIVYLDYILTCIIKIRKFTRGYNKTKFIDDIKTYDAVIRNLQTMGESVKRLPVHLKYCYPDVKWRDIASFRNILVHDYMSGIDHNKVWGSIQNDLPALKKVVVKMKQDIKQEA